ncbi:MAG TPA: hypothetical protein VHG72_07215 [Polyangia bacterium]|nr:hypothetical protein [Polyangia bacterium]
MRPTGGRRALPVLAGVAAALAVTAASGAARAQLRTCVEVVSAPGPTEALVRLVRDEIDRHPTHRAATADCQAVLSIELLDLGAGGGKWITGRLDAQVPQRERIGPDGIAPAVERLVTILVHNDPLVLRGPESTSWLVRQERALALRSTTHYGLELYELATPVGAPLGTLPGVGLTLRREVDQIALGVRVAGAFDPQAQPGALALRAQVDAQVEAAFFFRPAASVTLFASALVGLVYQRFEGPAPLDGAGATAIATSDGLALGVRAGVEALRITDLRLFAFVDLEAPAFVSQDPDHGVVDQWAPSAALGIGFLY